MTLKEIQKQIADNDLSYRNATPAQRIILRQWQSDLFQLKREALCRLENDETKESQFKKDKKKFKKPR